MSKDAAAFHPLLGAFIPRRRVASRRGGTARCGLLAALLLAAAGCGGQAAVALPHKAPGPAAPAALADPSLSPRQRVVEAYTGYWQALGQALDAQDAGRAAAILAPYAAAATIPLLVRGFKTDWAKGEIQYGAPVPHILSVQITGDHAAVHDCADFSHAGVQSARTGQVIGGLGNARVNMISTLVRTRGRWLVSNQVAVVSSCAP
jgi:hypothetical protein